MKMSLAAPQPSAEIVNFLAISSPEALVHLVREQARRRDVTWLRAIAESDFLRFTTHPATPQSPCTFSAHGDGLARFTAIAPLLPPVLDSAAAPLSRELRTVFAAWTDTFLGYAETRRKRQGGLSLREREIDQAELTATAGVLLATAAGLGEVAVLTRLAQVLPEAVHEPVSPLLYSTHARMQPPLLAMTPAAVATVHEQEASLDALAQFGWNVGASAALRARQRSDEWQGLLAFIADAGGVASPAFPGVVRRYQAAGVAIPDALWRAAARDALVLAEYDPDIEDLLAAGVFDVDAEATLRVGLRIPLPALVERAVSRLPAERLHGTPARASSWIQELYFQTDTRREAAQLACLEHLLAAGLDVDAPASNGETPLMRIAATGHIAGVNALLAAGADPRVEDASGADAATKARWHQHERCAALLQASCTRFVAGSIPRRERRVVVPTPATSMPPPNPDEPTSKRGLRMIPGGKL